MEGAAPEASSKKPRLSTGDGQTAFTLRLAKKLAEAQQGSGGQHEKNVIFSPLSIYAALALAAAGARGTTLDEILLVGTGSLDEVDEFARTVLASSEGEEEGGPRVTFASGVWHDKTATLKPAYRMAAVESYKAVTRAADFKEEVSFEFHRLGRLLSCPMYQHHATISSFTINSRSYILILSAGRGSARGNQQVGPGGHEPSHHLTPPSRLSDIQHPPRAGQRNLLQRHLVGALRQEAHDEQAAPLTCRSCAAGGTSSSPGTTGSRCSSSRIKCRGVATVLCAQLQQVSLCGGFRCASSFRTPETACRVSWRRWCRRIRASCVTTRRGGTSGSSSSCCPSSSYPSQGHGSQSRFRCTRGRPVRHVGVRRQLRLGCGEGFPQGRPRGGPGRHRAGSVHRFLY
jgi:hypothetical protein